MQSKITIRYPEDLNEIVGSELTLKLQQELNLHKQQIGYMIQDYYPKQKVRVAELVFRSMETLELFVRFSLEEFSSCAAIDTYDLSGMKIHVRLVPEQGQIEIEGEKWPG